MIECKAINKYYGQLHVLKDVSFTVEKGEIVSIVGASGAGKSTLLQIMGTLLVPDSGKVFINGTDLFSLGGDKLSAFRNREIGFVFQFHHLLPEFTAIENVMMPALIARSSGAVSDSMNSIRERAMMLISDMGLAGRATHKPQELSGGEQQRIAIARAIMNNPAVLFADEPSGNLDSKTKEEIHRLFFHLRDTYGQTIVIVTHDNSLAQMCDRSLEMRDGTFI